MILVTKKKVLFGLCLAGILLVAGLTLGLPALRAPAPPETQPATGPLAGKTILIDVGHGGIDSGANTKAGFLEKNFNLQVALVLKQILQSHGATVLLNREADIDLSGVDPNHPRRYRLDMKNRVDWATKNPGELLLSLHMNATRSSRVRGAILLYHPKTPYTTQSRELAHILQKELNGLYARYAQAQEIYRHQPVTGDFFVLKYAQMPAVIIEKGFVTNPNDRTLFEQPQFRQTLAEQISQGVIRYFNEKPAAETWATPASEPVIPDQKNPRGKLAIVIDDFGNYAGGTADMMAINRPMTMAVMPFFADSPATAPKELNLRFEILVNMPMETIQVPVAWYGPRYIATGMPREQIAALFNDAKTIMPYAVGVNNHMGVTISLDEAVARTTLEEVKKHQWYFLDSLTIPNSVFAGLAREVNLPFIQRDVFLDHNVTSVADVKNQLQLAGRVALKNGKAVAIGHVGSHGKITAQAIKEMIGPLEEMGVDFVYLSSFFD
ncbi:MAG: divergent polysaccharide deacetylase family protein [Heliobacteriaceae bacterium]|nr:divergent polysaccharide deacetylase family protein [Heliobacteriaceae bacterium]